MLCTRGFESHPRRFFVLLTVIFEDTPPHTHTRSQEEVSGGGYTDVKALHRLLMMELNMLQGTGAAGQRQSVLEVGVV